MRTLIQRVTHAAVYVDNLLVGKIGRGLVIFVGVAADDDTKDVQSLSAKIAKLRIFEDAGSKFNLSALETAAEILVVSQFTLLADTGKGRRPDFTAAARPEIAEPLIDAFATELEAQGLQVARGTFGAKMIVELSNDGPVTIWLDSRAGKRSTGLY